MKYFLSDQAIATFVLVVQKGILEQMDVTKLFRELEFEVNEESKLYVTNPPRGINVERVLEKAQERKKLKNDKEPVSKEEESEKKEETARTDE